MMGGSRTTIPMDGQIFRILMKRQIGLSAVASMCGVTRQAVNNWITKNRIPPNKLSILTKDLGLSQSVVDTLLAYRGVELPVSLSSKYKSKHVNLTSPAWMLDAMQGLATGNLMKRNKLINNILFDYIKRNIRLFSVERRELLTGIIGEYESDEN